MSLALQDCIWTTSAVISTNSHTECGGVPALLLGGLASGVALEGGFFENAG